MEKSKTQNGMKPRQKNRVAEKTGGMTRWFM